MSKKFSEEHKRKIGEANKRYWKEKRKNKEFMKKYSEKISKQNKGKLSGDKNPSKRPEVRKKISKALMGHKGAFTGKRRPEHSKIMSGRKQTKEHIKKRFKNKKDTLIERIIEQKLKEMNLIYFKQEIIIGFCVDFYLPEYNFIIECDGDYWHNKKGAKERDKMKNKKWKEANINILRLKEHDIKKNIDLCIRRIQLIIQHG